MIDPQETHFLDVAQHATIWLRRTPDGAALLADAAIAAGFGDQAVPEMGAAVLLVRLARSWPWPGGPEDGSFLEFIQRRCREVGGRGVTLVNRPLARRPPEPASDEETAIADAAKIAGDWVTVWHGKWVTSVPIVSCEPEWYPPADEDDADFDLPESAAVLLEYPLSRPVVFRWEGGNEAAPRFHLMQAISAQYHRIYEDADRYGVWGHDIGDLVLEHIDYSPSQNLIIPAIGS